MARVELTDDAVRRSEEGVPSRVRSQWRHARGCLPERAVLINQRRAKLGKPPWLPQ